MAEQWRILVIEGDENLNWNMVNSLQRDGYIVRGVTSGNEAIRLLWSEEYDIVICSQQMPDADGFDLLQWMRNYCPNARMIMLGIPGNAAARAQALEMGVASYLENPLDLHALKEELRRMLHSTGFSASLDSFDLLDVVQIITLSRKSIALVVSTGLEEQGILRFQNGELISAEYGVLRGEEAFFALAAHKNGTVVQRPWNEQIEPNVTQPLSRLIFQALQYRSKYANAQQASSELEAMQPGGVKLSPLPDTVLPEALQDLEDDDRPFQYVPADTPFERSPVKQAMQNGSTAGSALEALGSFKNTEAGAGPGSTNKEWWEPSSPFSSMQPSASMRAITDEPKGAQSTPTPVQKTSATHNSTLPSWLTEQPTSQHLPVMRDQTGKMPITPKPSPSVPRQASPTTPPSYQASSTPPIPRQASPTTPPSYQVSSTPPVPRQASPVISQGASHEAQTTGSVWPDFPTHPSAAGLRKIKPEEALFTGRQPAIKPGANPTRPAAAEWQGPEQQDLTGSMRAVKQETLHSLAALKKPGSAPLAPTPENNTANSNGSMSAPLARATEERQWTQPMQRLSNSTSMPKVTATPGQQAGRNHPALAAALQTLGYSVPGFVASAVVSLDGIPLAQVTVDDTDIVPLCTHAGQLVRSALKVVQQGQWEPYEHTLLISRTRYILLRPVGNTRDVFHLLITARETNPTESLEALANVESAIAAALR